MTIIVSLCSYAASENLQQIDLGQESSYRFDEFVNLILQTIPTEQVQLLQLGYKKGT